MRISRRWMAVFQSAPRAHARGDVLQCSSTSTWHCFNPRPALTRGATRTNDNTKTPRQSFNPRPALTRGATAVSWCVAPVVVVSIRAPRSRAGRPGLRPSQPLGLSVSIRAPRSRAGRPTAFSHADFAWLFQSAPRAHARGDQFVALVVVVQACFNPRPALTRGATQH